MDEQIRLLTEIRDDQREGLAMQRELRDQTRLMVAITRRVVIAGSILIAGLLLLLLGVVAMFVWSVLSLPNS